MTTTEPDTTIKAFHLATFSWRKRYEGGHVTYHEFIGTVTHNPKRNPARGYCATILTPRGDVDVCSYSKTADGAERAARRHFEERWKIEARHGRRILRKVIASGFVWVEQEATQTAPNLRQTPPDRIAGRQPGWLAPNTAYSASAKEVLRSGLTYVFWNYGPRYSVWPGRFARYLHAIDYGTREELAAIQRECEAPRLYDPPQQERAT